MADAPLAIVAAAEAPPRPGEWLCRERPLRHVVVFGLFAALAAGLLALPSLIAATPTAGRVLAYGFGGFCLLLALLTRGGALGALGASAWRLRAAPDGLTVNLRSYLNHHFAADSPCVLRLPRSAVRAVRPFRQELRAGHGDSVRRHKVEALDIVLRRAAAPEIEDALTAERRRMGRGLFGIRSRNGHEPVRLDGAVLRIYWRSPHDALTPGLDETLAQLARWFPTQAAPLPSGVRDPEADLLDLARAGDRLAAMQMARELYGMDLTEAKNFVDALTGRTD